MVDVEDLQDVGLHLQGRLDPLLGLNPDAVDTGLDARSQALVCLAGLHALGASDATYQWYVSRALAAGCTQVEVVGTLIAVGALVGEARAVSAARPLALALGHDIESIVEGANGRTSKVRSEPRALAARRLVLVACADDGKWSGPCVSSDGGWPGRCLDSWMGCRLGR